MHLWDYIDRELCEPVYVYVHRNGEQWGPYPELQAFAYYHFGTIKPSTDWIWQVDELAVLRGTQCDKWLTVDAWLENAKYPTNFGHLWEIEKRLLESGWILEDEVEFHRESLATYWHEKMYDSLNTYEEDHRRFCKESALKQQAEEAARRSNVRVGFGIFFE